MKEFVFLLAHVLLDHILELANSFEPVVFICPHLENFLQDCVNFGVLVECVGDEFLGLRMLSDFGVKYVFLEDSMIFQDFL